jgi:hypothetical protein
MAHSTSCSRATDYFVYSLRTVFSTLYTKSIIIVDFNMRTRSSICECKLFTRTRLTKSQ